MISGILWGYNLLLFLLLFSATDDIQHGLGSLKVPMLRDVVGMCWGDIDGTTETAIGAFTQVRGPYNNFFSPKINLL